MAAARIPVKTSATKKLAPARPHPVVQEARQEPPGAIGPGETRALGRSAPVGPRLLAPVSAFFLHGLPLTGDSMHPPLPGALPARWRGVARIGIEKPVHVDDEIPHHRIVHGALSRCLPSHMSLGIIGVNAHDVQGFQIAKLDRVRARPARRQRQDATAVWSASDPCAPLDNSPAFRSCPSRGQASSPNALGTPNSGPCVELTAIWQRIADGLWALWLQQPPTLARRAFSRPSARRFLRVACSLEHPRHHQEQHQQYPKRHGFELGIGHGILPIESPLNNSDRVSLHGAANSQKRPRAQ